jgi:hypothetical protein
VFLLEQVLDSCLDRGIKFIWIGGFWRGCGRDDGAPDTANSARPRQVQKTLLPLMDVNIHSAITSLRIAHVYVPPRFPRNPGLDIVRCAEVKGAPQQTQILGLLFPGCVTCVGEICTLGSLVDDGNYAVVFLNLGKICIVAVEDINDSVNHGVDWV